MKKLMIALVAVGMAVAANAAAINWSINTVSAFKDPNGTAYTTGDSGTYKNVTVYLIDMAKKDAIISAIGTDNFSATMDGIIYSAAMKNKYGQINNITETDGNWIKAGTEYDVATLYVDLVTKEDDPQYLLSVAKEDVLAKNIADGPDGISFSANEVWANGSGWQSVPEPTSGLLLLLGVAGLALRRRRA